MVTSKTSHVKTLILGGGITGLATAYALKERGDRDYLVLEEKSVPGGLCATTHMDGYHFDYGGHFLHLHTPQGKRIVKKLLGDNIQQHTRNAFIYTNGAQVPAPFQFNLWALRKDLRDLVLYELKNPQAFAVNRSDNFEDWCLTNFGFTLYEAFFRRYNEKLWGRKLTELTADWCAPYIPTAQRRTIIESAYKKPSRLRGYNTRFYYPKIGGCGALTDRLIIQAQNIRTNAPVTRIDLARKTVWVHNEKFTYDHLVSTLPLPRLVDLLDGHKNLKKAASLLEVQPVTVYHVAIARPVEPFGWVYCPDRMQPFYRVGLTSHFSPNSVPFEGLSLYCVELPGLPPQTPETEKEIWNGLFQKGFVNVDDEKIFSTWQTIPYAYVIFNKNRQKAVPYLLKELEKRGCYCAGRYGRWEYSFMETSLLQAAELAQKLA